MKTCKRRESHRKEKTNDTVKLKERRGWLRKSINSCGSIVYQDIELSDQNI